MNTVKDRSFLLLSGCVLLLLQPLKAVNMGQSVFGSEIVTRLPGLLRKTDNAKYEQYGIGEKECEIISLVAKGMNNREIAEALFLSEGTVRNYLSCILEKLNLRDRTQLAVFHFSG